GAALIWFGAPRPERYFLWQMVVSVAAVAAFGTVTRRLVPRGDRPAALRAAAIRRVWRFAGGMSVIAVTGGLLTQMDKIVLSKVVALSDFGGYNIAAVIASTLATLFVVPIFSAIFPRLSALVALAKPDEVRRLYRLS